jgi:hypothetical protein
MLRSRPILPLLLACAVPAFGQNVLNNGPGPGTVNTRVDGWGLFGGCPSGGNVSDALYAPANGGAPIATSCFSSLIIITPTLTGPQWLATNQPNYAGTFPFQGVNPPVIVLGPNHIKTTAPGPVVGGWAIDVEQKLCGPDPNLGPLVEGSSLQQIYTLRNTNSAPTNLSLLRFIDTDLGPGTSYLVNRCGATRQFAMCGAAPPLTSNREMVFAYDLVNLPRSMVGISCEGVDASGTAVKSGNYMGLGSASGHPTAAFITNPLSLLNNTLQGDTNLDLLVNEGTGNDFALGDVLTFPSVPPGGSVVAHFRTRWSSLDKKDPPTVDFQARDVTCTGRLGNFSQTPGTVRGLLCVNGSPTCASVPPGVVAQISLAAPAGGPNVTHYILFATIGHPKTGALCGSPEAADYALWGPQIHPWGIGAFPVSSVIGNWGGGCTANGFALASSIPGVALLTAPLASGPQPCGNVILGFPSTTIAFSFTLQALVFDLGARQAAQPLSLSNAVDVVFGNCTCQTH